jgi:hypothetical protein
MLQEDEVGRIVDHALGVEIMRVIVVGLFGAALRMLENGLQSLAYRGRYVLHARATRFARLLARHACFHPNFVALFPHKIFRVDTRDLQLSFYQLPIATQSDELP